jgi:hypothetical protein
LVIFDEKPVSPASAALVALVEGLDEESLRRVVDVVGAAMKLRIRPA